MEKRVVKMLYYIQAFSQSSLLAEVSHDERPLLAGNSQSNEQV